MESFLSTVTGGRYYSGGAGQEGLGYPELYNGPGQPWPRYPGPVPRTEESSAPPPPPPPPAAVSTQRQATTQSTTRSYLHIDA